MVSRNIENVEILLRVKDEELKREKAVHTETGCELYKLHQELGKFQLQLDNKHNEYTVYHGKWEEEQKMLSNLRENYQRSIKKMFEETKRMHSVRDEVDALCLRLYYLNKAKQDVSEDLMVLKRAAEKVNTDLSKIVQMENQIAKDELGLAHKKATNIQLHERVHELEEEIDNTNLLITKLESEIHHANISVERKQGNIDILNKKLERSIRESGGQEVGPLDAQISNMNKAVAAKQDEIGVLEQQWLKEQNELVMNINERDKLAESVTRISKQLSILTQKKLRVDNEITIQEREKNDLEKELRHLQNDITRMNTMIANEKTNEESLNNENKLSEIDFARDHVLKDKEDLLNELVEVERTIMLWEKKVQLCEETKKSVDCNTGQGEISVMRHEIHRMETLKSSLLQKQERLIQALERSILKRDIIFNQSDVLQARKDETQMRITAQRHIDELKRKLKFIRQNSSVCTKELEELAEKTNTLEGELFMKKTGAEVEQKKADELMEKLQSLSDQKQINIFELQMRQHATAYWEQIKQGKYRRLCPSITSTENERTRQVNRARSLMAVIDQLVTEFPQIQQDLEPVRHLLGMKLDFESPILNSDSTKVDSKNSSMS
ncbi:unnamed protein product [Heterobilharzia americana]|nr:unnamed protein product [Heterobilharzia americana]